jgi:4-hydroxy-tetrahydrodipicolinate reductase
MMMLSGQFRFYTTPSSHPNNDPWRVLIMNIAIIGYGRMGQRIAALAEPDFGTIVLTLDMHNNSDGKGIDPEVFQDVDVAIDFSHPSAVTTNLRKLITSKTPVVVGTTGWLHETDSIRNLALENGVPVIYGSNFSLGVQRFLKLVERAGYLFGSQSDLHATIHEVHHTGKADAPSGTAITLAERWLDGTGIHSSPVYGVPERGPVDPKDLVITSQRVGDVTGEHTLRLRGPFDDITIRHEARSRDAFAIGALKAAQWLVHQQPGLYFIEEVIEQITG